MTEFTSLTSMLPDSLSDSLPDSLPEDKQRDIAFIATALRNALDDFVATKTGSKAHYKILKILLFGSHAKGTWVNDPINGYVSDYDILVIVNKPTLVEEFDVWQTAEDQIARHVSAPLGLIVHSLEEVNTMLQQGHYFFKDIREQGIELYTVANKSLQTPGQLTAAEQLAIANKHFSIWHESADQFFITAQEHTTRQWLSKAAFELHQAAERFLACTLLVCTNYLPKTHNIEHLRSLCAQQNADFTTLFPADDKFHRRCFQRLKRAYIDARYSEQYEITLEELNWLIEEVEKLKVITEAVCQAEIAGLK
ncbi:HEPN domain-containing protein [Marinomonas agarivorans]|nr:HEPN domain-containing protein [Marinomonas agarivorans]